MTLPAPRLLVNAIRDILPVEEMTQLLLSNVESMVSSQCSTLRFSNLNGQN